jgi:hypothetical protein
LLTRYEKQPFNTHYCRGGPAYLLTTEEGEKQREKLARQLNEQFPNLAEQLTDLKDQFLSAVTEKIQTPPRTDEAQA